MKLLKTAIAGFILLVASSNINAKFDGVVLGASVGGNINHLKDKDLSDQVRQLGANGKIYLGLGKSFLDALFLGGEVFMGYDFLANPEEEKGKATASLNNSFKWGGYLKAGLRPTEDFLLYGLFGVQNNNTSASKTIKGLLTQKDGVWTSVVGVGIEYAVSLGISIRLEGFYEIEQSIQFKELQGLDFNKNQLTINIGIAGYI